MQHKIFRRAGDEHPRRKSEERNDQLHSQQTRARQETNLLEK